MSAADAGVGSTIVGADGRLLGIKFAHGWFGVTDTTTSHGSYGPRVELILYGMSIDSILSVKGSSINVVPTKPPKVGDTVTKENWAEIPIDSVLAIGPNRAHVASSLSSPSGRMAVMNGSINLSRDNCIGGIIEYIPS